MLSIFSTLKETLFLWVRNFWYLVALTIAIDTPDVVFSRALRISTSPHTSLFGGLSVLFLLSDLLFYALGAAAILGLLRRELLAQTAWRASWNTVRVDFWTLFVLSVRISLIAVFALLFVAVIMRAVGLGARALVFGVALYLLLAKYALAYPLVVVEKMNSGQALRRSWQMTKGHFLYVAGCYLCLWGAEWVIGRALTPYSTSPGLETNWLWIIPKLALELTDTLWFLLSWCMYNRIRETDEPPEYKAVPVWSPPEST